jgi:hypothetical protein
MAQDLTVNIKTTSDVPQAMDRAKGATVSFGKQVEDIQKKFSMAFKDVFLSFLGPLALLGIAMNYIGKLIDDNRKKHEDANQAAIDGTNELMSAEDRYYSRKRDNEKKDKENKQQAALTREQVTEAFLLENPIGRAIMQIKAGPGEKNRPSFLGPLTESSLRQQAGWLSKSAEIQAAVQLAIKEQARENPLKDKTATTFKTPEGFSNVVGVGANPVIEAMAEQTELARQQLAELQKLNAKATDTQTDFTKDSK